MKTLFLRQMNDAVMTDRELLKQIAGKDRQAFRLLYDRYRRLFFGWTFSRLHDEDTACDVMQDFWLEVWSSAARIPCNDQGMAKDYLLRRLTFRIIDQLRIQCRRLEITDEMLIQQKIGLLSYTHVQEDLDFEELQRIIGEILRDLPPLLQKVYEMRCIRNLSAKETAYALGIAESTVYNSLSSAVSVLRRELTLQYKTGGPGCLKILLPVLLLLEE